MVGNGFQMPQGNLLGSGGISMPQQMQMQNVKANNFMAMNTENRTAAASFIRASYASVSHAKYNSTIGESDQKGISVNRCKLRAALR